MNASARFIATEDIQAFPACRHHFRPGRVARVKIRAFSIAACAAFVIAGCGGSDDDKGTASPAANAGKELFTQNCSNCHTLKDAGTTGAVGPNLDQLKPGPDLVTKQVTNGGGGMPAFGNKLSADQIKQVAAYVSSVAGK
jgi:mono/diheme cytochrome c family protein